MSRPSASIGPACSACVACGGRRWRIAANVRDTPIRQCTTCGLATWSFPAFDPAGFYADDYWLSSSAGKGYADYFRLARATQRTHRARIARIRRYLPPGAEPVRLLDAGCGPGAFLLAARQQGWTVAGVEVSHFAARHAREEHGLDVWQGQVVAGQLGPGGYDAVTLWDVIEHLPDPAASLRAVHEALRPGGVLALSTGDIRSLAARATGAGWHLYNLPEHLWFFTRASLHRLLRAGGFRPVWTGYDVGWYTLEYLVERLEATLARSRGRWTSPLQPGRPLGLIGQSSVPATLLDILTIVAVRTS